MLCLELKTHFAWPNYQEEIHLPTLCRDTVLEKKISAKIV